MNCPRRYIHYPAIHIETIFPAWKYKWRYFLDDKETIYVLQSGVKNIWAISYNVVMNNLSGLTLLCCQTIWKNSRLSSCSYASKCTENNGRALLSTIRSVQDETWKSF